MYKIYKHTMPNGKCYIGQTNLDPIYKRWNYGHGYREQAAFYHDILQVGWNNIKHEILEEVATKREATERERYYILLYRSNEPEFGYNKSTNASLTTKSKLYSYVRCKATGEVFESAVAAGEKYGRTGSAIGYAIKKNSFCAGMKWEKVQMTKEEYQALGRQVDFV